CYCALNPNENPAQFGIFFSANRLTPRKLMDGRMFGGEHLGSPLRFPQRRCWFAIDIEPWEEHESVCGSLREVYMHSVDQPGTR
ncbi:MAG: hypothetical protein BECKG1743E_GA0114224_104983, partial [Candidatus Kentron sp. G]